MKTRLVTAALATMLAFTLVAQQQTKPAGAGEPEEQIIAKLGQIVQAREQLVEIHRALQQSGRKSEADGTGLALAEIELAEARLTLARERRQPEAVTAGLKELVAAHERRVEQAKELKKLARASDVEIGQAQVALLEAQVRLLREPR